MTRRRVSTLACTVVLAAVTLAGAAAPGAQVESDFPFRAAANDSPRIAALRGDLSARKRGAISEFWNDVRRRGAPLVEPSPHGARHSLVTFVWRGTAKTRNVVIVDGVAAGVGGADAAKSEMRHLEGSDVWYRTYEVRNDARFTYTLSENDSLRLLTSSNRGSKPAVDPLNPRQFRTDQSSVELPDAPPFQPDGDGTKRTLEVARFPSPATGNEYTAQVYLPPGFRRDGEAYPLIVVLDGTAYTTTIPSPAILDALIASGRIKPVVAVFLETSSGRANLLSCSRPFSDVLATDVVPRVRSSYHAGLGARDTAIGGSSLGGLASTCAAIAHPDVFGNVLSQSGSYWWTPDAEPEWVTRQLRQMPAPPVRFFLEVGAMEIPEQLDTNRRVRDALIAGGATVTYREFNGNHSYFPWRAGFADGLVWLFSGPSRSAVRAPASTPAIAAGADRR
jgi:enterochelin esterase-like enzyme